MKFEDQRRHMVEVLCAKGIKDINVINTMLFVPRHEFVSDEFKELAYKDCALAIEGGQTISQPYIVAMMTQLLELTSTDEVLEIGTGSGYQTAILAKLAKQVYSVERLETLSLSAKKRLKEMGFTNIHFRIGDGSKGWVHAYPPTSRFQKIIVTAGAPKVPESLVEQLAEGGLIVIPSGSKQSQYLVLGRKQHGIMHYVEVGECLFVPLIGEEAW